MNTPAYSTYQNSSIETADQGKLILIVYDFAIRQCKMSKEKFTDSREDIQERSACLLKAQQAINELVCGLDMTSGREISKKLYALYIYMGKKLVEANIKKNVAAVDEVLGYLNTLRDAWVTAVDETRKQKGGQASAKAGDEPKSVSMVG